MALQEQVEEYLIRDEDSPSGPRENVPARLNGNITILGEDNVWHEVEPIGMGKKIFQQILAMRIFRNIQG